ncbi:peptide ABC transporter ATP-binding protein [Rhizobium sp. Leaf371]|uniref:ABC transporter ATP-binding protein n=1 Tax=Rhizobium sp. Leaf371 TaxID=1736355 RepID=UPI0007145E91|nr:ABC transporter ATP-binding protein [Rhizobium sp. Leaf371]KQS72312.1 peptide ABC transporter ATP-binding protein [Rhizobium sp. Leaf371]
MTQPLLRIENLAISIDRPDGARQPIVTDISLTLEAGETLGIVGESGSGKSLLALAVMGLLPPVARPTGRILLEGRDLLAMDDETLCSVRGRRVGLIFQEPLTALNPAMTVGDQIAEGMVIQDGLSWRAARREAITLLDRVRMPEAARLSRSYPHALSGGQRQRVGIAIALAMKPALMIADEPTTALDVTVQAEVLDILDDLTRDAGMALILVSHDLGVIARMCARTLVLYAGRRLEEGLTRDVLTMPLNPYTRGLLRAVPRRQPQDGRLQTIPGTVPSFAALPPGCVFSDRCPERIDACHAAEPRWTYPVPGRGVRCIRAPGEAMP